MTIRDVAKYAKVSPATVSNVINGTKYVSDDLKERVNKAICDLDFQVDYAASIMKKSTTHTIGVILPTLNLVFTSQVINGIQSVISNNNYRIIFYTADNNIDKEINYVRMLTAYRGDGIIVDSIANEDKDADYLGYLATLHNGNKRIPVVSIERNFVEHGIHSVHVNNVLGGEIATNHLIECGCREIAIITGPTFSDLVIDRIKGYKNILTKHGISFDDELIIYGDFTPISGYRAVNHLIKEGLSFDSVFACNDEMAVGALRALLKNGISIPDDVKLIGFDNTFISSIVTPQISTINVPKFRIGYSAARILIDLIRKNGHVDGLSCEMPISVIIRGSTEKGKVDGWELDVW